MSFLIKTVKIFLLIIFIIFIYQSYTTENFLFLDSKQKSSLEVEDILNDLDKNIESSVEEGEEAQNKTSNINYIIKQEISKIKRNNFNTVTLSKYKSEAGVVVAEKEKYFNYHVYGLLLNLFNNSNIKTEEAGNNDGRILKLKQQTKTLENMNIFLLVIAFSCLLIWINLEFGILPALFSGIAIILNPYYFVLSKSLFVNLWGIILPSSLLGVLLSIERIKRTYIQKQILISIFLMMLLKLLLSYRNIWFMMFTILLVIFYHSHYYMWLKSFSYKRALTFFKVMIYALIVATVMEIAINVFMFDSTFSNALNHTLSSIFPVTLGETNFIQRLILVLKNLKIYVHMTGVDALIFFIVVSFISYWFYNIKLRVHNRQFYYLFIMTLASFLMAVASSYIETASSVYVAISWIYPATILSFAILGLLIKIVVLYYKGVLVIQNVDQNMENNTEENTNEKM